MNKLCRKILALTLSVVLIASTLVTGFVAVADEGTVPSYYGTEADGFDSTYSSWPQALKPVDSIKNLDFANGFVYWSGRNANNGGGGTKASSSFKLVDTGTNKYVTLKDEGYVDNMRTALFDVSDNVSIGDKIVAIYFGNGADVSKFRVMVLQDYIRDVTYDETTGRNNTSTNASPGGETQIVGSGVAPSQFKYQADATNWTAYIAPTNAVIIDPTTTSTKVAPTANIYLQVMITRVDTAVNVGDKLDFAVDNIILAKNVDGVYYDISTGEEITQETIDNAAPPSLEDNTGDDNQGGEVVPPVEDEEEEDDTPPAAYYGTEENGFSSATNASFNLKPVKGFKNLDFSNGFVYWSGRNGGASEPYASDCFDLVTSGNNKYVKVKDSGWVVSMRSAIFSVSGLKGGDTINVLYDVSGDDGNTFHIKLSQFIFKTDVVYDETTGKAAGSPLASGTTERIIVGSGLPATDFMWNLAKTGWTTRMGKVNQTIKAPESDQDQKFYFQITITSDAGGAVAGDKLDAAIDNLRIVKIVDGAYYDLNTGEPIENPFTPKPEPTADILAALMNHVLTGGCDTKTYDYNSDNDVNILDIVYVKKRLVSIATSQVPIEGPMYAAREDDVYSNKIVRYQLSDECVGWYFTPKEPGNYQTIILMHGQGNPYSFRDNLLYNFNNWVKQGYIEPMVVVIPQILDSIGPSSATNASDIDDFQYFIYNFQSYKRFNLLMSSIENGSLSSKIDTTKKPYVAGFSMGGMAALHAGVEYKTRISQVGALSPAKAFYLGEGKYGIYNYASQIQFSTDPDANVYLSAGLAEVDFEGKPGFIESINRYAEGIKVNNASILTKFEAPTSWGGHSWALAQKEIFMFLHIASYDRLPTNQLVEAVCANSVTPSDKIPTVVSSASAEHS